MTFFEQYLYKIIELDNILNEKYENFVFDLKVVSDKLGDKLYGAIDDLEDSAITDPTVTAKYKELGEISEFGIVKNPKIGSYYEISVIGIKKLKAKMLLGDVYKDFEFGVHNIPDDELVISNVEAEFNIVEADVKKLELGIDRITNHFSKNRIMTLTKFKGEFGNQIIIKGINSKNTLWEEMEKENFLIKTKKDFEKFIKNDKKFTDKEKSNFNSNIKDLENNEMIIFKNNDLDKKAIKSFFEEKIMIPANSPMIVKRKTNMVKPISKI